MYIPVNILGLPKCYGAVTAVTVSSPTSSWIARVSDGCSGQNWNRELPESVLLGDAHQQDTEGLHAEEVLRTCTRWYPLWNRWDH
jgi:hypothetical protein